MAAETEGAGLVCVDLDGTLCGPDKGVSHACRTALAEASAVGLTVAFASGRHPAAVFDLMDELGLPHTCVCLSGAVAYLEGREVFREALPKGAVRDLVALAQRRGAYLVASASDLTLTCGTIDRHDGLGTRVGTQGANGYDDLLRVLGGKAGRVLKVSLHLETEAAFEETRADLSHLLGVTAARSDVLWFDVTPAGCTKATGIGALRQALGVGASRVAVVGDDENDIDAIRQAGLGIAMGNAIPAVKAAAQVVVADNVHDGCAQALRLAVEALA